MEDDNMSTTQAVIEGKANGQTVQVAQPQVPSQPTYEQLKAQLAALQALQASSSTLTLKVSEKGAVSVYGLGKWPLTLYRSQMIRVLDAGDRIRAFITAHPELKDKAPKA